LVYINKTGITTNVAFIGLTHRTGMQKCVVVSPNRYCTFIEEVSLAMKAAPLGVSPTHHIVKLLTHEVTLLATGTFVNLPSVTPVPRGNRS
jgi:hypothetical protein